MVRSHLLSLTTLAIALLATPSIASAQESGAMVQALVLDATPPVAAPSPPPPAPPAYAVVPIAYTPVADAAPLPIPVKAPATGGFVLDFGLGVMIHGGDLATGVSETTIGGLEKSLELRLGYFFTPHFGFLVGARGAIGSGPSGCEHCATWSVQVPLLLEYSFLRRQEGLYARAGIGMVTRRGFVGGGDRFEFHNDLGDVKASLGYRLVSPIADNQGLDLGLSFEGGQYNHGSANGIEGDVRDDAKAFHYTITAEAIARIAL